MKEKEINDNFGIKKGVKNEFFNKGIKLWYYFFYRLF